jgi:hypothetical protein
MGMVVAEFENEGDVAVFADFARRMGAKVDFRFGGFGFDYFISFDKNLCRCEKRGCAKKGFGGKSETGGCEKGFFKE